MPGKRNRYAQQELPGFLIDQHASNAVAPDPMAIDEFDTHDGDPDFPGCPPTPPYTEQPMKRICKDPPVPQSVTENYWQHVDERESRRRHKKMDRLMAEYTSDDGALMWNLVHAKCKPVIGRGAVEAKLMVIGDKPFADEVNGGQAFSGASSRALTDRLAQRGLTEMHCWFTNVLKIRPEGTRRPTYEEVEDSLGLLRKEIRIVQPSVILCLGDIAAAVALNGFRTCEAMLGDAELVSYDQDAHHKFSAKPVRLLKDHGKHSSAVRFHESRLVCRIYLMTDILTFFNMPNFSKQKVEWLDELGIVADLTALPRIPWISATDLLSEHFKSKGIATFQDAADQYGATYSSPNDTFIERSALHDVPLPADYLAEHVEAKKGFYVCVHTAKFIESQNEYRFFCRTYEGYSFALHVTEPRFEFWLSHASFNPYVDENGRVDFRLADIEAITSNFRWWMITHFEGSWRYEGMSDEALWDAFGITLEYSWQRSAFFYQPVRTRFLHITFRRYDILRTLKDCCRVTFPYCEFYETKIGPVEQLFYTQNIYSYGWIRMNPARVFEVERETICDLEYGCAAKHLHGRNPNTGQAKKEFDRKHSLIRFANLDGEMLNQGSGAMPVPESDPIVRLCVYVSDTNSPTRNILFEQLRHRTKPQQVYDTGRTNYREAVAFVVGPHQPLAPDPFDPKFLPYAPLLPEEVPEPYLEKPTVPFLRGIYVWRQFLTEFDKWLGFVGEHRAWCILHSEKLRKLLLLSHGENELKNTKPVDPDVYKVWRKRMKAIFATWHTRLPDCEIENPMHQPPRNLDDPKEIGSVQANWHEMHPIKRAFFFVTEEDMLAAFVEYRRQADIDIFSGHNVSSFDLKYIIQRIQVLNLRWDHYWEDRGNLPLSLGRGLFDQRNRRTSMSSDSIATKKLDTRANGMRIFTVIDIPGTDIFDTLHYAQKDIQDLDGYTLSQVANAFHHTQVALKAVGDTKHDVPFSAIPSLFANLPKKLTDYCMQDTELCERILNALNTMNYVVSTCRLIGCMTIGQFYTTGVQVKILNLLMRRLKLSGLSKIFPDYNPFSEENETPVDYDDADEEEEEEAELEDEDANENGKTNVTRGNVGYKGASVLDVKRGFYRVPIPTLDFSSLYPSIMDAENLSHNTMGFLDWFVSLGIPRERLYTSGELHTNPFKKGAREPMYFLQRQKLTEEQARALPALDDLPAGLEQCIKNPEDGTYTPKIEFGDLVMTGRELADARAMIKREMSQYTTSHPRYKVLDPQQQSVKVLRNSQYGFTGVSSGRGACKPLGSTVTHRGRQMINKVKDDMEKFFDATVVGGDTDSVFVLFKGVKTVADILKPISRLKNAEDPNSGMVTLPFIYHCVNHVNARVKYPNKIVFEKTNECTAIYEKKKQDGTVCMPTRDPVTGEEVFEDGGKAQLYNKGTEGKRRSTAPYAKQILEKFCEIMFSDPRADLEQLKRQAENYVREKIIAIRNGNYDYSQLILSRYYARKDSDYADQNAPVLVINRKKRARGEEAHAPGSRIPMVVVEGARNAKFWQKVEVPDYALEHRIPLDIEYYINKHLVKPLMRKIAVIDPSMAQRMFPPITKKTITLRHDDPLTRYVTVHKKCLVCEEVCAQGRICEACVRERTLDENLDIIARAESEATEKLEEAKKVCYACMAMDEPGEIVCANVHCSQYPIRKDLEYGLKKKLAEGDALRTEWGIANDW